MWGFSSRTTALLAVLALFGALTATAASAQTTAATCDGEVATIVGTPGADNLVGTPGPDVIAGLQGNDTINGGGGDDIICGGQGNDVLRGGEGFDIIFGAQGDDVIYAASGTTTALREDTRGARMFGGAGNDVINGSARWDRMQGGPGNDSLFGFEGRDWMRAGADNDTVNGGLGIDDMHGGNGRDTIELTSGDLVRGGAGLDLCNLGSGTVEMIISCGLNEREQAVVPAGAFTHTSFGGDTWTGEVHGVVPAGIGEFNNVEGRCFLVLGQITPGAISSGSVVSNGFTTPDIGVIVDGEYIDDGTECETAPAELVGYEWILLANATSGTDIPFYSEIFLPTTETGTITEVIVGDPRFGGDFVSIPPVTLPSIPIPTGLRVGSQVPDEGPIGVGAEFSYTRFDRDTWAGRVTAIESAPLSQFNNQEGRCVLVLGELTPTEIDEGIVSNPFSTPPIGVIIDGRYVADNTRCDTEAVEDRGFGWILDAEVTANTRYEFFAEFFIPEADDGTISHVVVGDHRVPEAFIFSSELLALTN